MSGGIVKGYALEAVLGQLQKWHEEGEQAIYFGALSTHPQADEDCTFGELIQEAVKEAHLGKYYWSEDGPSLRKLVWVCPTCRRRNVSDACGNCGAARPTLEAGLSIVAIAKRVLGIHTTSDGFVEAVCHSCGAVNVYQSQPPEYCEACRAKWGISSDTDQPNGIVPEPAQGWSSIEGGNDARE